MAISLSKEMKLMLPLLMFRFPILSTSEFFFLFFSLSLLLSLLDLLDEV